MLSVYDSPALRRIALGALIVLGLLYVVDLVLRARAGRVVLPPWRGGSPFPGLSAFTPEQSEAFFGRDAETRRLLDRMHPRARRQVEPRFIAVIGSSGAGKSSLVQAGVIPRLSSEWTVLPPVLPGKDPVRGLARALGSAAPALDAQTLEQELRDRGADALVDALDAVRSGRRGVRPSVLLYLDQAEELAAPETTLAVRRDFIALLHDAMERDRSFWVIATLRSEFLTVFLEDGLEHLFQTSEIVGTLPRERLLEVVEGPASLAGIHLEPGLLDRIVTDVGTADALPLLAYTLSVLYEELRGRDELTIADYERIGGVTGALPVHADRVRAELEANPDAAPVLPTLLRFVTLTGSGAETATRRRVTRGSLTPDEQVVVDAFIAARLLTGGEVGGEATIQVAHEALFREWGPLRSEIEAGQADLRRRAELERLTKEWQEADEPASYLLRGDRLHEALALDPEILDTPTKRFLELSRDAERVEVEQRTDAVAERVLASIRDDPEGALLLAVATIDEGAPTPAARAALTAALTASRLSGILDDHGDNVRAVAWSPDGTRLATGAEDGYVRVWNVDTDEEPVVHATGSAPRAVAWSRDGTTLAAGLADGSVWIGDPDEGDGTVHRYHDDTVNAIAFAPDGRIATASHDRRAGVWSPGGDEPVRYFDHPEHVRGVDWSRDGRRLATACLDHNVRIWDADAPDDQAPVVLSGHRERVEGVAWAPVGNCLASVSADRRGLIWDTDRRAVIARLDRHDGWVQAVDWSPDGRRLVTASRDGRARIWSSVGEEIAELRGHAHWVHSVSWSPDGRRIATGSYDRQARLWDASPLHAHADLREHSGPVQALAWSRDGTLLASASHDRWARVWDVDGASEVAAFEHQARVHDVEWSPDGARLVTGAADDRGHCWSMDTREEVVTLESHGQWVEHVAWSRDGARIATGSNDGTARVWDAATGDCLRTLEHGAWVWGVAFSPDGRRLVTGSQDQNARIWVVDGEEEPLVLDRHRRWITDVAWSPDGLRVATASVDRTAIVWDALKGEPLGVLRGHTKDVQSVDWSPDGRRLATASDDGMARTWDAETFEELTVPCVHKAAVLSVAWAPSGDRLATGAADGSMQVWDVAEADLPVLLERAAARCFRSLTVEERRRAMLSDLPRRPLPPGAGAGP